MPKVVGVKFKKNPKTYFFASLDFDYKENRGVLVETARGLEYGTVVMMPVDLSADKIKEPLKNVLRLATKDDLITVKKLEDKALDAIKTTQAKADAAGLDMRVSDAEYTFDGTKLTLYFTAEGRVDFRDLVRELASAFKARIELRQIGSRDECKIKGGLGPCGRACCCSSHLPDFEHATIKMAKNQNLSLNPQKISGLCGRLMCCLAFENKHYTEVNSRMPKIGSEVEVISSPTFCSAGCGLTCTKGCGKLPSSPSPAQSPQLKVTSVMGGLKDMRSAETPIKPGTKGTVMSVNQLKETVSIKIMEKDSWKIDTLPLKCIAFSGKNKTTAKTDKADEDDEDGQES